MRSTDDFIKVKRLNRGKTNVLESQQSGQFRRPRPRISSWAIQLRAGFDPQSCRCRRLSTGNLRSRHAGDAQVASRQQHKELALHHSEKHLAQSVEKAAERSSNV